MCYTTVKCTVYVPDMKNIIVIVAGTVEKSAIVCVLHYCICPGFLHVLSLRDYYHNLEQRICYIHMYI